MNYNSKNNYSGKKIKQHKKNSDNNFNFSNTKSSKKNNSYKRNTEKKNGVKNSNEGYKKNSKVSSSKRTNQISKSSIEFSNKSSNIYNDPFKKKDFDDWIWGKHSVFEALNSQRDINRIWCTSEIFSSERFYLLLKELKSKGVLVEEVSWNRLSQLTLGAAHQGVALQLACSKTISLRNLINLSKDKSAYPIILALDGITDPHNVGAIIRSAEAFDCKGIIIPQRRSAGLTGTVAKVAAGALEHLPVSRVVNLNRALEELRENGFLIIGLSGDSQLSISKFREKTPLVVIVGSEDKGISLLTQKKCDFLLSIPLKGKTTSLNASVASAIALFHLTN